MEPELGQLDDATQTDQQGQPAQQDQAPAPPSIDQIRDPDDRALAEAEAALRAEEEAKAATEAAQQAEDEPPIEQGQPGQQEQPGQQSAPRMVPIERLSQLARVARVLKEKVAYLEGKTVALSEGRGTVQPAPNGQSQPAPQQAPQQPPAQQDFKALIAEERKRLKDAAALVDKGDMTMAEYAAINEQVDDRIADLRTQSFEASRRAAEPPPKQPTQDEYGIADRQALENQRVFLEQNYPYLNHLSQHQMDFLVRRAYEDAAALGVPIKTGAYETARLRGMVAQLSDFYGKVWHPNLQVQPAATRQAPQPQTTQPATPTAPAAANGQNGNIPGLSPQAAARLSKMQKGATMPPDPTTMGSAASTSALPTEEQILQMTEEQIAALPATTLEGILSGRDGLRRS